MRVLYISYDGLTDNLGSAQVVPYLLGLARGGHEITVLTCEKPARASRLPAISQALAAAGISWKPLVYHKRPPVLSTVFDLFKMLRAAKRLHRATPFSAVHCRSYIPALVGLSMKKRFGVKLIFDMRGFWADERVEGGLWNLKNPLYRFIYRYFKRKETELLRAASSVISLTERAKEEMSGWPVFGRDGAGTDSSVISVIPCCADLEHFQRDPDPQVRETVRNELDLQNNHLVFVYLGSLGTWYMLDEMLIFFRMANRLHPHARFLILTPDAPSEVFARAVALGVDKELLRVKSADRSAVPRILSATDIGLFFIRASYSKMSSSATKLAELLSMGIPVITNSGIGDHETIFERNSVGHLLRGFSETEYEYALRAIPNLLSLSRKNMRTCAETSFSLELGIDKYLDVYSRLSGDSKRGGI